MEVFFGKENLPEKYKRAVICIGNFDGVHYGHQQIINKTIEIAKSKSTKSLMITFDQHPRIIFSRQTGKSPIPVLTTIRERNEILETMGLDAVLYLKAEPALFTIEPEEFLKSLIVEKINASDVIIGYDFHFGKNRAGNVDLMKKCGNKYNFCVDQFAAIQRNNEIISSSIIRNYLENGNLEKAEEYMGRKYKFSGTIVHGSGRGRHLGFPTANVKPDNEYKLIPGIGVYLVRLKMTDETKFGLCNIGVRPTFNEHDLVIEIYIYDNQKKDLYEEEIEIALLNRMRDEIKYETKEALIEQMEKDKVKGLELIKQYNQD